MALRTMTREDGDHMMRRNEGIYRTRHDRHLVNPFIFADRPFAPTPLSDTVHMMINNEAFVGGTHDEETYHNPFIG